MSGAPQTPDEMYDAAVKLKDADDLDGAVALLMKILEVDNDHLHANMALGVYLQKQGKLCLLYTSPSPRD